MMQAMEAQRSAEEQAASKINQALLEGKDRSRSPDQLKADIRKKTEGISRDVRRHVDMYVSGVLPAMEGARGEKLQEGIGGLYTGDQRKIALSTLQVRGSIQEVIAQNKEVGAHEKYHADHHHLEAMKAVDEGDQKTTACDTVLVMGGKEYTEESLIEGLVVDETGDTFCSDGYRKFQSELRSGMASAGVDIDAVRQAVNVEKDLTLIDDRSKAPMSV